MPRRLGSGTRLRVASVTRPSVPSAPTKSFCRWTSRSPGAVAGRLAGRRPLLEHRLHPVAGAVLHHAGHRGGDGVGVRTQGGQHAANARPARVSPPTGRPVRRRPRATAGAEDAAVGQNDLDREDMVLGSAVGDGRAPRGVGADHAAQAAVVLAGGVGGEEGPVLGRLLVEAPITSPAAPGPRTRPAPSREPGSCSG